MQPTPMHVKKTAGGFTLVTVALNLRKERVVDRDVEYKYKVATPAGAYWEELSIPGVYSNAVVNRVLQVPKGYSLDVYEKYDDVIMKDNDEERRTLRIKATKFLLPGLNGSVKKISNHFELLDNIRKFEQVLESHVLQAQTKCGVTHIKNKKI